MAWSILDALGDPSIMSSLFGGGYDPNSGVSQAPALQPPQAPPTPPMPPSPSSGGIGSDYASSAMAQPQQAPPMPPALADASAVPQSVADLGGYNPNSGVSTAPGMTPPAPMAPPLPPPQNVGYAPGAGPQGPLPPTPGQGGIGSDYATSANAAGAAPPFSKPAAYVAPGTPPMPPPLAPGQGAPISTTGNGLSGALGINPQQRPGQQNTMFNPNTIRTMLAGMGKGLSAVGQLRPGATVGQAIAAGAGGALTGSEQQRQQMTNQESTAFRDMLAAKASDDTSAYKAAQAQYLTARAQTMMTNGGVSKAYQNTPQFKVLRVEEDAAKWEKGQQIMLQKQWVLNNTPPEQQKQDTADLAKKVEQYKQNLYRSSGIDPDKAQKIKDQGTSKDNPLDMTGVMTNEQFMQHVPPGAWFKNPADGKILRRPQPKPQQQGANSATNNDDLAAMTDQAA